MLIFGQSVRSLKTRLLEPKQSVANYHNNSVIYLRTLQSEHLFDFDSDEILDF